jgi:hypothetical protein
MKKDFLLVIGDHEPLAWILTTGHMAFPAGRGQLVRQLSAGDRLFLYTTRRCFHAPARDRGRVIGEATVATAVKMLSEPIVFGPNSFPVGCDLTITGLAARGSGPQLAAMVHELNVFPDPRSWGIRMRRVLVPLDTHDAELVHEELEPVMSAPEIHLAEYTRAVKARSTTAHGGSHS